MINPLILKEERCVPISSKADQVLHDSTKRAQKNAWRIPF